MLSEGSFSCNRFEPLGVVTDNGDVSEMDDAFGAVEEVEEEYDSRANTDRVLLTALRRGLEGGSRSCSLAKGSVSIGGRDLFVWR